MFGSLVTINAQEQNQKSDTLPKLGSADQVDNRLELDQKVQEPLVELTFLSPYLHYHKKYDKIYLN